MVELDFTSAWKGFQLQVRFASEAKRIGILGASGSGKSLTLQTIAGIQTPKSGKIAVDGRVLFDSENRVNVRTQKRRVGYLFQNYALFPAMNVRQNIAAGIPGKPAGAGRAAEKKQSAREETVRSLIERFGLTGLEDRFPSELSGGQQQRTALARILACDPDVILLDEPFSALDMYLKDRMQRELFEQLREFEKTVILVSHDRDEIYRFSEEVVILEDGRVIAQGETKQLFSRPGNKAAARLTGCKNISAAVRLDAHTLLAENWGITLHVRQDVPGNIRHIGYRAHEFLPVWGEKKENCLPFCLESSVQLPFERNYYIRPAKETFAPEDVLTWLVQREQWPVLEEKGVPDYLQLQEKDMLFLF